jgi:gamma-glutamyltranspeptidase / glutathione hydrolase
MGGDMQAQGHA